MIVPTETYISSTDAVGDPTPYCGTSTSAVPYKTHIFSTNIHFIQRPAAGAPQWRLANRRHACLLLERCCMGVVSQIKDLDNSSKALPYKSTVMPLVGEGLAPPENLSITCHPNAEQINLSVGYGIHDVPCFSATCHPNAKQIPVSVGMFLSRRRHPSVALRQLP